MKINVDSLTAFLLNKPYYNHYYGCFCVVAVVVSIVNYQRFEPVLSDVVSTDRHVSGQRQFRLRSWERWAQNPHVLLKPFVLVL